VSRFAAEVARDPLGYRWEELGGYGPEDGDELYAGSVYLRPNGYDELMKAWRRDGKVALEHCYDPFLKEPALFRIFAALPLTTDAILAFANEYGDITRFEVVIEDGGTTFWEWREEIKEFRHLVAEADKFLAKPVGGRGQLKRAQAIADFIDPILSQAAVYMSTVIQNGMIGLRGKAYDLLDVMRLQLIESIVEHKSYRTCDQCGKPFEVTPQINRSDRIYCSDNCRVKAYQRRRKHAIAMRTKGDALRDIAKKLGSDVPTVKKWVGETTKEE